eukprot:CAMPEP_0198596524 /NCGR_PEP_ID=MMETSP1462-20131121/143287_1 /TAXON_ID=1333877 /ORGANISM="Brandtodinium nutriculum, Strain RCC3387" /LENGTH=890 /DNA_ID=CAMNT_0044328165 /DNA_START=10 /DNA_END=2679 /DNA_ORIENTATION=+
MAHLAPLQVVVAVRHTRDHVADHDSDAEKIARLREDILNKTQSLVEDGGNSYAIRINQLQKRLRLEQKMMGVAVKFPCFIICQVAFVWAISLLVPAESVSKVHRHLVGHFGLSKGDLDEVRTFEDLYQFATDFEHANEELQATSSKYWCEKKYFELTWNDALGVPQRSCPSPRLHALGFDTDAPTPWTHWAAARGIIPESAKTSLGGASSGSGSSGSSSRRLAGGGSTGSIGSAAAAVPECKDDDLELKAEEGKPWITCNNSAAHTCELDLGILLCPKTCGYCPGFEYEHSKFFDKPQLTMLPVMVHQTRVQRAPCHHFAHTFETQPHNVDLNILPPLDGKRNGRVLTCIDRTKQEDQEWAFHLECPKEGAPEAFCTDGVMHDTKLHYYHGTPVYAKFLTEPKKNIAAMRAIGWMDMQTESVTLSTLVYTEGEEIFTSISVVFAVDKAGNIIGRNEMVSYTDLTTYNRGVFTALLIISAIGSFVGLSMNLWQMWTDRHCDWGFACYELLSRAVMCVYSLVLQVTWQKQIPMAEEYDHLLHQILDFHGHGHAEWENLVQGYFDAKALVYHETRWLMMHRIAIYIVLYVQFLQLVMYFDSHPRMAMLTSTLKKSLDNMFHFFFLFLLIFAMLGFTASWMLGGDVTAFATVGIALGSQTKMLFGEWIYADNADDLTGVMVAMYWIYALTFMLLLLYTLLNFFLAIVVDAFVQVKTHIAVQTFEQNVCLDIFDLLRSGVQYRSRSWPARSTLLKAIDDAIENTPPPDPEDAEDRIWTVQKLHGVLPDAMKDPARLASFLHSYSLKCPHTFVCCELALSAEGACQGARASQHDCIELAFVQAGAVLKPLMREAFPGATGPEWSYERIQCGDQVMHRVSANFMREKTKGADLSPSE